MIVTLTGENSFKLQSESKRLISAFVAEHTDMALERLDGEEANYERLQEALTSLPFLASKKMVVLRAPSANKQFVEHAEQLLGNVGEETEVLLIEPKLDKRTAYYKFLKKETDFKEFTELDISGLANWLVSEAKASNGSLSSSDARYLVERVGTNQQLLFNELNKLLTYDAKVTRSNIDLLTEPAPQSTIFQLLEAAFGGRTKQALQIYKEQRALKAEPQQIIAMLTWQLHILALLKTAGDRSSDQIAKEAKLSPYVVKKSQGIANKLSLAQLQLLISKLVNIDVKSKSTTYDLDEALQNYILTIGKGS